MAKNMIDFKDFVNATTLWKVGMLLYLLGIGIAAIPAILQTIGLWAALAGLVWWLINRIRAK